MTVLRDLVRIQKKDAEAVHDCGAIREDLVVRDTAQ
jgi:hypothetical protein